MANKSRKANWRAGLSGDASTALADALQKDLTMGLSQNKLPYDSTEMQKIIDTEQLKLPWNHAVLLELMSIDLRGGYFSQIDLADASAKIALDDASSAGHITNIAMKTLVQSK